MRSYGLVAAVLTCIAFVQPVRAADKNDPANKPKNYAEAAEDCEKAIERRKHELANQYSTDVWMLKDKFQKAGDLEKALVADKEWSRSLARKPLVQKDLAETLPELANLQREYIERFANVAEAVATEFLQDLKKESSDLAKAGKLADGRVLQQEIDTIKRLYLGGRDGKARGNDVAEGKADGDVIAACEELIRQKRVATQAQYVGELEAMEKSFQAKGALEDLFAAKAERKRFIETPILAEENLVETPDALRELQQKYLELQQNLTTSVAQEFIAKLEQQKQALTIEGKLDEAVNAKANAEKIGQRFLGRAAGGGRRVDLLKHLLRSKEWQPQSNGRGWRSQDGNVAVDYVQATVNWVELPYVPPLEYDFSVKIVREDGAGMGLICGHGDKRFVGVVGGDFDRYAGFDAVDGRHFHNGGNKTSVRGAAASLGRNGVEHVVTVQIRKRGAVLLRDGQKISELATDFSNVSVGNWQEIARWRRGDTIGINWYENRMRIVGIEVLEISGAGKLLE